MTEILTINFSYPRVGTCRVCNSSRTVYPVTDAEGKGSWACKQCAGQAEAVK